MSEQSTGPNELATDYAKYFVNRRNDLTADLPAAPTELSTALSVIYIIEEQDLPPAQLQKIYEHIVVLDNNGTINPIVADLLDHTPSNSPDEIFPQGLPLTYRIRLLSAVINRVSTAVEANNTGTDFSLNTANLLQGLHDRYYELHADLQAAPDEPIHLILPTLLEDLLDVIEEQPTKYAAPLVGTLIPSIISLYDMQLEAISDDIDIQTLKTYSQLWLRIYGYYNNTTDELLQAVNFYIHFNIGDLSEPTYMHFNTIIEAIRNIGRFNLVNGIELFQRLMQRINEGERLQNKSDYEQSVVTTLANAIGLGFNFMLASDWRSDKQPLQARLIAAIQKNLDSITPRELSNAIFLWQETLPPKIKNSPLTQQYLSHWRPAVTSSEPWVNSHTP